MAETKETVILDFQVEQGSAIKDLEETKKSIIGLKKEQQELNKAYKAGDVTLEEYASESVRLEGILKKQQSTYNNVQKSVTGVKTQMDKLIDSNKSISKEFANTASKINVAGVSVGDLTTKIASFATPAGAAVGIVTALGAAYARSTIGAKDLEFAQNQLGFATTYLTNQFASLISSAEDGEGLFSNIVSGILFQIDTTTAVLSKLAAQAQEDLQQVKRDQELAQVAINERLGENAELLEGISNSETTIANKKMFAQKIEDNITQNTNERLALVNKEIDATEKLIIDAEDKEFLLNKLFAERSKIQKEEDKQLSKIGKQLNAIVNAENKRLEIQRASAEQSAKTRSGVDKRISERETKDPKFDSGLDDLAKQDVRISNARIKQTQDAEEKRRESIKETTEFEKEQLQDRLDFATTMSGNALALFKEGTVAYKVLAISDAIVNTYKAANLALGSYPPPASFALAAVSVATGLANVAKISGTGFASGGYTGHGGKYQPAGVVHKGEVVWSQADVALAGGPSRVDSMRPTYKSRRLKGYADGGAVVNDATSGTNQALLMANSLKNMPKPIVSWVEGRKVGNKVEFKERISRA